MTSDELKVDATTEMLARMWIECDPNRGGAGCEPDDLSTLWVDGEERQEPRWKWFIPRAQATIKFLEERGASVLLPE